VTVRGRPLVGISYEMPVASAQAKSALLLAGLRARGVTAVREPAPSRDHTERMLRQFGAQVECADGWVRIEGGRRLCAQRVEVPGDFSAAAFFLVAGLLVPGSRIELKGVGLNPTRTGLLEALAAMGAQVQARVREGEEAEPVGDMVAEWAGLRGTQVGGPLVPRLIDEVPVLCVAAALAQGQTVVRDAAELRVKESDRISALCSELARMGADMQERPDGMVIRGVSGLRGAEVDSHGDHRLAMALAVAGLVAEGTTVVHGAECIGNSFPGFADRLRQLGARAHMEEG